jgi:hypothetical protein
MKVKRFLAATMAALIVAGVLALPAAGAVKLTVESGADRSLMYAEHTCDHDPHCVKYGITNCSRQALHVVLCRIFLERATADQGRYACTKLVRVALDPYDPIRAAVTGTGPFSCH